VALDAWGLTNCLKIQQPVNEGVLVVDEDIVVNEVGGNSMYCMCGVDDDAMRQEQQENQTPQPAFAITMSALVSRQLSSAISYC
jgi:hypothetical protein